MSDGAGLVCVHNKGWCMDYVLNCINIIANWQFGICIDDLVMAEH